MSGDLTPSLPGTPPPVVQAVYEALSDAGRAALVAHLLGGTSAEWLASTLAGNGHRVSASSIRTYRRALRREGSVTV